MIAADTREKGFHVGVHRVVASAALPWYYFGLYKADGSPLPALRRAPNGVEHLLHCQPVAEGGGRRPRYEINTEAQRREAGLVTGCVCAAGPRFVVCVHAKSQ